MRLITLMKSLQSRGSYSPPCTMQCFIQQSFFSFVKKKKMLVRRERGLWEERVGYSFDDASLSSRMILSCLSARKQIRSLTFTVATVFIQIVCKPVLGVCQHCLVGCPHMELRVGIGLGACTHANTHTRTKTHSETRTHTNARTHIHRQLSHQE